MTSRIGRRKAIQSLATVGLVSLTGSLGAINDNPQKGITIQAPDYVPKNRPFSIKVDLFSPFQGPDGIQWVEIFLGRELVGRWEFSQMSPKATLEVWLVVEKSATLRVRDYFGRVATRRLRVVG
ncbi:MAG: hypothetical protein NZ959_00750 [Armatimonadetes bacterium]|nr:hypothetical protein [Armatimonadota bacterium]MDW8121083.1 hypothetical protein [Armatimonadota bacterium]